MVGISLPAETLMARSCELVDKAMRNLVHLREEASEGMATPLVAHLVANLVGFLFRRY